MKDLDIIAMYMAKGLILVALLLGIVGFFQDFIL
jgi:hypothetical protein